MDQTLITKVFAIISTHFSLFNGWKRQVLLSGERLIWFNASIITKPLSLIAQAGLWWGVSGAHYQPPQPCKQISSGTQTKNFCFPLFFIWNLPHFRFKQTRFENVGEMLAQRKELFRRRRNVSDVAFVTGLIGIILMIIHTELIVNKVNDYTNESVAAIVLKVFITLSTVDLVCMVIWFHLIDIKVSQRS